MEIYCRFLLLCTSIVLNLFLRILLLRERRRLGTTPPPPAPPQQEQGYSKSWGMARTTLGVSLIILLGSSAFVLFPFVKAAISSFVVLVKFQIHFCFAPFFVPSIPGEFFDAFPCFILQFVYSMVYVVPAYFFVCTDAKAR